MADFVTHHHGPSINYVEPMPWTLFFDGSLCKQGDSIGIGIISPLRVSFECAYSIKPMSISNQAEYEAILRGLQLPQEVKANAIEIFGDSQLIINQLIGLYECKDDILRDYYEKCQSLIDGFPMVTIKHIPKAQNQEANRLAQSASSYQQIQEVFNNEIVADDWRREIIDYLKNPSQKVSRKLRFKSIKYVLLDDQLYYKTVDGVLLKCLNREEAKVLMGEVHEGICGAHQSAYKMK